MRSTGQGQRVNGTVVKLIYQSYLPYQGRYPRLSGQAKVLQEQGFDVTVLACDRDCVHPKNDVLDGIPVERIHVKAGEMGGPLRQIWPLLVFSIKAFKWLMTHPYDTLVCHNLDIVPVGCAVRIFSRRKVVFDAHEPNYYALWDNKWQFLLAPLKWLEFIMSRMMHGITVTNNYQIKKYRGWGVKNVALIGNYARPDFGVREIPAEKRNRDTVTFGRLGTIYPDTGFEQMALAFAEVSRRYPQARLLVAGRVIDKYKEKFHKTIEPIRDRMELIGAYSSDQIPTLYKQLDASILVYPRSAWFRHITPTKYYDSLANGVPVVMTDIGGIGDEIREHECGLVVDENDIDSIVSAMSRIIEDRELRNRLADNALAATQGAYSWDGMARDYIDFHAALLEGRKEKVSEGIHG